LNSIYEFSQELYQVIYPRKHKIFEYIASIKEDQNEQDLINLIIATEIINYSVVSIGMQTDRVDNQQQELLNSVEKLIQKCNYLTLSSQFLEHNKIVSKFVTKRGDGGLILSM